MALNIATYAKLGPTLLNNNTKKFRKCVTIKSYTAHIYVALRHFKIKVKVSCSSETICGLAFVIEY